MQRRAVSWRVGKRELIAMVVGVLLYAGTNWLTHFSTMSASVAAGFIRPGVAIPIFAGFAYGPIVGFVVGFFGNLLFDLSVGYAAFPPSGSTFAVWAAALALNWQLGNGLMGFIPGLYALGNRRYYTVGELLRAMLVAVAAIVIGIGVAAALDPFVFGATWSESFYEAFLPTVLVNLINAFILVPLLLYNFERLDLQTTEYFRTVLMRRLLFTILIAAGGPATLLALFLIQANMASGSVGPTLLVQLLFTVALTTVLIISGAALLAQTLTRPLLRLTDAAQAMEQNRLDADQVEVLKRTAGDDEVAHLSRVFGDMAQEVIEREQALRREVRELRVEIDHVKRQKQVQKIVQSESFAELQQRAKAIRERRERRMDGQT